MIRSRYTGAHHPGVGYGPPHVDSVARSYGYSLVAAEMFRRYEWRNQGGDQIVWEKRDPHLNGRLACATRACALELITVSDLDGYLYRRQSFWAPR